MHRVVLVPGAVAAIATDFLCSDFSVYVFGINRTLIFVFAPHHSARTPIRDIVLAKPNYQFEKRQRDLEKKKKQEEKRQRKLADKKTEGDDGAPALADDSTPQSTNQTDAD